MPAQEGQRAQAGMVAEGGSGKGQREAALGLVVTEATQGLSSEWCPDVPAPWEVSVRGHCGKGT